MNRFMLSQNRVQSRARNIKAALTLRHCKLDGDESLGFVKMVGMYISWSSDLLAYLFTDLLVTYLLAP